MPLEILHGAGPEQCEILPLHFVQGFGSHDQNDKERMVQNDIGNFGKD